MASLVLLAHGSAINPDSGASCRACAAAIERMGLFEGVQVGFWKESPSWSEAVMAAGSGPVYVVPFFLNDGYYVRVVMPRELASIDREVIVCAPVGTDPRMVEVILDRAEAIMAGGVEASEAALVLVGHGTRRMKRSAECTRALAAQIEEFGHFSEVISVFTDDDPQVARAFDEAVARDVVVVPVMTAEGFHTRETIPEDLGVAPGGPWPVGVGGRRVWISEAVGTSSMMVAVVLDVARRSGWGEKLGPG
jgi:sirohydrochlorin cobaltochelatase